MPDCPHDHRASAGFENFSLVIVLAISLMPCTTLGWRMRNLQSKDLLTMVCAREIFIVMIFKKETTIYTDDKAHYGRLRDVIFARTR